MKYWLMKNEVSDYCIDDLAKDKSTAWTGVRNYQARNFMRDEMAPGDLGIFYHSNAEPSGAAGILRIQGPAIADETQFDKKSKYFDAKATKEKPRWFCQVVKFRSKFKRVVSIQEMRDNKACKNMLILRPGNRLSITPLSKQEFEVICKMSEE
ncbi:MAG: EVE domain-containing protein [Deltaproteobacteria bacterium CG11_big_fil_rev_8_21_14_0_20_45_16]|nr:MAG: EVE domain-containing protein [Deltaproteobacteria bacterium CG11_big_fil_rev_8_21_14_0_20_45_16]